MAQKCNVQYFVYSKILRGFCATSSWCTFSAIDSPASGLGRRGKSDSRLEASKHLIHVFVIGEASLGSPAFMYSFLCVWPLQTPKVQHIPW